MWKEEEIKILPFWVHIQHSPREKKGQSLGILNSNHHTNLQETNPKHQPGDFLKFYIPFYSYYLFSITALLKIWIFSLYDEAENFICPHFLKKKSLRKTEEIISRPWGYAMQGWYRSGGGPRLNLHRTQVSEAEEKQQQEVRGPTSWIRVIETREQLV